MSVLTMALLAAAAIVAALGGLPMLAREELTMFAYIAFAAFLFLVPGGLVAAELGGMYAHREGGVYIWVSEAFGRRWGFLAVWLQWIENVVWYPTTLAFAAVAAAFMTGDRSLGSNNTFIGLFCIAAIWLATLIALRGTDVLVTVAKYGFLVGTVVPGIILLGLFVYWVVSGKSAGWDAASDPAVAERIKDGQTQPRWLPHYTGLGTLSLLAAILLLFSGIEVQAVHAVEMRHPRREFPWAIVLAAIISVAVFSLGGLAVAGLLPPAHISLTSGVLDALDRGLEQAGGTTWLMPFIALAICYGALGGTLAWIRGPVRGLMTSGRDGCLPPVFQRTNAHGSERNILLAQAGLVTVVSSLYLVLEDVSSTFVLISAISVSLYIIMYLLMYAAAIRLRYTEPELDRRFSIPGGIVGMWLIAGVGAVAVAFALVLAFVPPDQLPVGNSTTYVGLVAAGCSTFVAVPLLIYQFRKPSWATSQATVSRS